MKRPVKKGQAIAKTGIDFVTRSLQNSSGVPGHDSTSNLKALDCWVVGGGDGPGVGGKRGA